MFELERTIQDWRNGLLQSQNVLESDIDELESHLRDEVDSLMLAGLSAEEAFMVSTHRIGDRESVDKEFAKVNPSLAWRRRAFWMLFGIMVSMVVSSIASICSLVSGALMTWLNYDAVLSGIMVSLVHIGVFVILLFAVVFGLGFISKTLKSKFSVSKLLIICVVCVFVLKVLSIGFNMIRYRMYDAETIGKIALASNYTNLIWSILWPILLVAVLCLLWSSRPQYVR